MVRSRNSLIAFGAAVALLAACGSDDNKSDGSTADSTSGTATSTSLSTATTGLGAATTTTGVGGVTVPPVTVASATSVAATATSTAAGGASTTTTTAKGRTVTSPSDNVKKGDTGEGVKQIQQALKSAGFNVTVDGDFGAQTEAAVKQFQKQQKLTVDGVVGKITWGKLSGASSGGSSAATSTTTK